MAESSRADERLKREFPLITLPVLILHGTLDRVTKPSGSQLFYDSTESADQTLEYAAAITMNLLRDVLPRVAGVPGGEREPESPTAAPFKG